MPLSQLHFANPLWLLALLIIPFVWALFFLYYEKRQPLHQLEAFIDKHLIPHLLLKGQQTKEKLWTKLLFWSAVFSCLVLALAGPRSNFREIPTLTKSQNLAILLDLSLSMNATDISPSRLGRAKQKIEDLLKASQGVKIGLIAFAADPHMIVPMTEDKETIKHLLTSLDTDLVAVQGSRLSPALQMADTMLGAEMGKSQAILVISDGGFEDGSAIQEAKRLSDKGIVIHTLGVGSPEGAPLKSRKGDLIKKNGVILISKLEKEKFRQISQIGHGRYFDGSHSEEISLIIDDLNKESALKEQTNKIERIWEEQFYLFLLPVIPFFLLWHRRGYIFIFLLLPTYSHASFSDLFYNKDQKGKRAFEREDYAMAKDTFEDPYRKGVAYYRMGDFESAEEMFRQTQRKEVACNAAFNLGNALAQQNKLNDAVKAYENVLEKWPDHQAAKDNLELVKKMLEKQKKEENKQPPQKQKPQEKQQKDPSQKENEEDSSSQENEEDSTSNETSSKENENESNSKENEDHSTSKEDEKESSQKIDPKESSSKEDEKATPKEKGASRSQEDLDADLWLSQIKNDTKSFLKNKFTLESKKNGSKEDINPW